jgi:hypothetical protein
MKPTTLDGISDQGRRCEALRRLGEQAMAKPARIWEELEAEGIRVTPGVIYQAITHYNLQPKTLDEGQGAEAMTGEGERMHFLPLQKSPSALSLRAVRLPSRTALELERPTGRDLAYRAALRSMIKDTSTLTLVLHRR